eukprot:3235166-Rhodomonas_salina.1
MGSHAKTSHRTRSRQDHAERTQAWLSAAGASPSARIIAVYTTRCTCSNYAIAPGHARASDLRAGT